MGSTKILISAACLLLLQICRANGQSISSEAFSSTSVSNPSLCGGQFVIPAIIKPVVQPETRNTPMVPDYGVGVNTGYSGCAVPPIIIEEGSSSGGNDILWPLLMLFALKNIGGGSSGRGCSGDMGMNYGGMGMGYGGMGMGYGGMGMGYGGMGMGYGGMGCGGMGNGGMGYYGGMGGYSGYGGCGCGYNGCGGCGCGYNGCGGCGCGYNGCGGCNFPYSNSCDSSCGCNDGSNEINLVIKTDSSCCQAQ